MCLAVPGKIKSTFKDESELRMAKVDFSGIIKVICIEWLPEANTGDYILAHAGTAISKVDETEAEETLKIFDEWAATLEEEDRKKDKLS